MAQPTRVVQQGAGEVRPLLVLYHCGGTMDRKLRAQVSEATTIANFTGPGGKHHYSSFWAGLKRLPDLVTWLQDRVGSGLFWPVCVAGFSEGCQGVTQQIGEYAEQISATICCDGLHQSWPPYAPGTELWRYWFARCGARFDVVQADYVEPSTTDPMALVSCSQIRTPQHTPPRPGDFMPTRDTIELITGWQMPPGTLGHPHIKDSGNVSVWSYPGADKEAHRYQLVHVLPELVGEVAARYGFGPGQSPAGISVTTTRSSGNGGSAPNGGPANPPPPRAGPAPSTRHLGRRALVAGVGVGIAVAAVAADRLIP